MSCAVPFGGKPEEAKGEATGRPSMATEFKSMDQPGKGERTESKSMGPPCEGERREFKSMNRPSEGKTKEFRSMNRPCSGDLMEFKSMDRPRVSFAILAGEAGVLFNG